MVKRIYISILVIAAVLSGLVTIEISPTKIVALGNPALAADPQPIELVSQRTATSKTYSLGNGRFAIDSSIGAVHYKDAAGQWQNVNNRIVGGVMSEASYTFRLLQSTFNAGQIAEFSLGSSYVRLQPMALEWSNDLSQIQQVAIPQAVTGTVANTPIRLLPGVASEQGKVTWQNAYGTGRDFSWLTMPTRLTKVLTIPSLANLPTPPSYIISGGNAFLRLNMIFSPSSDLDIYVDGNLWDKATQTQSFGRIEFRKAGQTVWDFAPLLYWDSAANQGESIKTLCKSGKGLYIEIRVPYSWLQSAVFPVSVDTTIDVSVAASADDARERLDTYAPQTNGVALTVTSSSGAQTLYMSGMLFTAAIAQGSTITNVYITGNTTSASTDDANMWMAFQLAASPPTFSTATANISSRALTSANVSWVQDSIGLGVFSTANLSAPLQEVVNAYTTTTVAALWWPKRDVFKSFTFHAWDNTSGSSPPSIHIEYSSVTAPTVTSVSSSAISATTANCTGNITATGGENPSIVGIQWGTVSATYTTNETSSGNFTTGTFNLQLTSLPAGTTIYWRAEAYNSAGWGYGSELNFLTKPAAPTNVAASENSSSNVTVTWTVSTGATDYHVWRDAVDLGSAGNVTSFVDTGANPPTITGGNTLASDGTSTDNVSVSLSGTSSDNGTLHTYKVVASNATGNSADSATDTGRRIAGALSYQWEGSLDGVSFTTIVGATSATYEDATAPAGNVTAGTASASDGTSGTQVVLSLAGETTNDGLPKWYQCVLNAPSATQNTSANDGGYRGVGAITYQWQRSAADSDAAYSNIAGATTDPYNDTGGVLSPDGRYYKCLVSATGAASQNSTADRGYMVAVLLAPTGFKVIDLGAITLNASWGLGTGAAYTMVRVKRDSYPTSPTDGELFYYNGGVSANGTGYDIEVLSFFFRAWSFAADNVTYSSDSAQASIGGDGMSEIAEGINSFATIISSAIQFIPLAFMGVLAFWRPNAVLMMVTGGLSALLGFSWRHMYPDTAMGLSISIGLLVFWLVCWGFAFTLIFKREVKE